MTSPDRTAYYRAYYDANRERKRAASRIYYQSHKPEYRERARQFHDRNRFVVKVARTLRISLREARQWIAAQEAAASRAVDVAAREARP